MLKINLKLYDDVKERIILERDMPLIDDILLKELIDREIEKLQKEILATENEVTEF